jgi:hypothetical protein
MNKTTLHYITNEVWAAIKNGWKKQGQGTISHIKSIASGTIKKTKLLSPIEYSRHALRITRPAPQYDINTHLLIEIDDQTWDEWQTTLTEDQQKHINYHIKQGPKTLWRIRNQTITPHPQTKNTQTPKLITRLTKLLIEKGKIRQPTLHETQLITQHDRTEHLINQAKIAKRQEQIDTLQQTLDKQKSIPYTG